uniref:Signal peptide peptidase SppA n=1 Tax=uncultured bacterium 12AC_lac13 TaxID=1447233 RepID=X2L7H3_9BACT|nr:signal peptide peptidase SppA [uncultured bacterium 12AC_lac13]
MIVLSWLWGIVKSVLNGIAKVIAFAVILIIILAGIGLISGDGLPSNMVLELDARKSIEDKTASSILDLGQRSLSVMDIVMTLDTAQRDPRVKGVFIRVGSGDLSVPKAEELREALKRFRTSGKFVIAHSQTFYSGGLGDYVVAAASDEIWMQPVSSFFSAGSSTSALFLKGLFDKVEATPQFVQRYEYKNVANMFTQTDFTPAHREATLRILQSWYDSSVDEASTDRSLPRDTMVSVLDNSPVTVEEVKEKGLITHIGYDDEARDAAETKAGDDAEVTEFERYAQAARARRAGPGAPTIAFVHAAGEILEGNDDAPLSGSVDSIYGDVFAKAIREAANDNSVRAILLRVDSPGGSAIASDQILQAVKKAKTAGKPVVVSMGSVAASGGYYISLAADRILALPGTLTGSIGVVWGKVAVGGTMGLVGVTAKELGVGRNALFLSGVTPWNEGQMAKVNQQADIVYADFTSKVAEGRNMPLERVQDVARGRVWTGADALERGLVDELGGFWAAVDDAKMLAGIDADTRVRFKSYPESEGFFGTVSRVFETSSAALKALQGLNALMEAEPVRALIGALDAMPSGRIEFSAKGLPIQ